MIKKALEYIIGLNKPEIREIGGEVYSDKGLCRISHNPKAEAIEMGTLSSLVDYIKSATDTMSDRMIIHVVSPTEVDLYSCLDADRQRENLVTVYAAFPDFPFDKFIGHEHFIIGLQSKFVPNEDSALLMKFAGTVEGGSIAEYGDDGISQKATVKTRLASKSDAVIPSPVRLKPYRTFMEVEQPESQFIFRMRDTSDGVQCALFEADGGAWRQTAMEHIREFLENELDGQEGFTVIA